MSNRTVTVSSVFLNNQGVATSVSRTVNAVVVGDNIVADFRQTNPGVINSAYTEFPVMGTDIQTSIYP